MLLAPFIKFINCGSASHCRLQGYFQLILISLVRHINRRPQNTATDQIAKSWRENTLGLLKSFIRQIFLLVGLWFLCVFFTLWFWMISFFAQDCLFKSIWEVLREVSWTGLFSLRGKEESQFFFPVLHFLKKMLAACYMTEVRAVINLGLLCKPWNILSVLDPYERCVLAVLVYHLNVMTDLNNHIKGGNKHQENIPLI